jgi:hypothetical protein
MARDAISRQYDVDKNLVTLTCADSKGSYVPGLITFFPKTGRTIDLKNIRESINNTRLSAGTNMGVDYLEITALGAVEIHDKALMLKVAVTGQPFTLNEAPSAKGQLLKLRDALGRGEKVTSVTGRVQGWTGIFPNVLKAQANAPAIQTLHLIDFEIVAKRP